MDFYREKLHQNKFRRLWCTFSIILLQPTALTHRSICEQEHDMNPFTKQPHSAQYKKILAGRKKLPVFAQMTEFYKMVSDAL